MPTLTPVPLAFIVQMDTGSSDLWVYSPGTTLNLTNTTDITTTESYGQGVAEGTIVFGEFKLGGFTVPSQGELIVLSSVFARH